MSSLANRNPDAIPASWLDHETEKRELLELLVKTAGLEPHGNLLFADLDLRKIEGILLVPGKPADAVQFQLGTDERGVRSSGVILPRYRIEVGEACYAVGWNARAAVIWEIR